MACMYLRCDKIAQAAKRNVTCARSAHKNTSNNKRYIASGNITQTFVAAIGCTLEHDVIFVMGKIFQVAYFLYRPRALLFVISFNRCASVFFKFWSFVIPAVVCWISKHMNYAFARTLRRERAFFSMAG